MLHVNFFPLCNEFESQMWQEHEMTHDVNLQAGTVTLWATRLNCSAGYKSN